MRTIRTSTTVQPQSTSRILMIRPAAFAFNEQTAGSNAFQRLTGTEDTAQAALEEFDEMVRHLVAAGVEVLVVEDTERPYTPDAVFSNNWVSYHQSGKVVLYPMLAENRRLERRRDILKQLEETFKIEEVIDLSYFEKDGKFLEGTGSMVLDRRYKIAFAALSPRTHREPLQAFAEAMGYELVLFTAFDRHNRLVYHTNVMLCIGDIFAVVCLEAVTDPDERYLLRSVLEETHKVIVEITLEQMEAFAGNMLMVRNREDQKLLVMSTAAYDSLTASQRSLLEDFVRMLPVDLPVIEANGGGSARCMMTEIHLPLK